MKIKSPLRPISRLTLDVHYIADTAGRLADYCESKKASSQIDLDELTAYLCEIKDRAERINREDIPLFVVA